MTSSLHRCPRQSGSHVGRRVFGVRRGARAKTQQERECHGSQTVQADEPWPPFPNGLRFRRDRPRRSRRSRCLRPFTRRLVATTRAASPSVIRAAATKRRVPHHRLQAQQGRRARQGRARSSTTRTAPPASRCCTTSTAKSATSLHPKGLKVGDMVVSGRRGRHQARQRACRWPASPSVPLIHDSRAAARQGRPALPAPPAPAPSSWLRKASTRMSAYAVRLKCAASC